VDAVTDKSCRYTAGLTANVPTPDSMVNYTLGHHHQNGAAASAVSAASTVSAASASMAAAAQFYHQAAAASAAADPLSSCSQPGAASAGQPIPDIPRYPWMSITGEFHVEVKFLLLTISTPRFDMRYYVV
jgi:Antp family protein